jgi:hypothetical protein
MTTFFGRAGVLSAMPLTSGYESGEKGSPTTIDGGADSDERYRCALFRRAEQP